MDNYNKLKDIIKDYLTNVHFINEKRLKVSKTETQLMMQELKVFTLLQNNIEQLEKQINGIS